MSETTDQLPEPETNGSTAEQEDGAPEKNPYEDLEEISTRIDKVLRADAFSRVFFENAWARNVFFFAGAQWLKKQNGRWERRNLPSWFPKAQTNKFAEKCNDLITQLLSGGRVPISYQPATDDPADAGTADVGERIRDVMYTEAKCDEQANLLASWKIITGNAFGIPYYDMDESHGTVGVPFQSCAACGTKSDPEEMADPTICPACGGNQVGPAVDETGAPDIAHQYPIGAIQMEVAGPFEIRGDHRITDVRKWRQFVHQKKYDLGWAKEKWPDFKDAITPDSGAETDTAQYFLDLFANLTPDFTFGSGLGVNGNTASKYPKVTAYCLRELPSEKFPEGLFAIRIGRNADAIVEAGPLPTMYGAGVKKGQRFLPLIHWRASLVPGRLWGKTPADDLITLQVFRNMIEANIRLSIQLNGNYKCLLPKGSGVDILTGEPGQAVPYNPVSVGGTQYAKPERIPADLNNLGSLIGMLKVIDDSMERVAGTFFLQGGNAPPGVTAACMSLDTKALTKTGWKTYDKLTVGEEIYALNTHTGRGEWSALKQVHVYPDYAGEIVDIDGREISASVTANHKWPVQTRRRNGNARKFESEIRLVETSALGAEDSTPLAAALDKITTTENNSFVELIGWIVTEGCYQAPSTKRRTKHWTVAITQSYKVNKAKCDWIERALTDSRIEYRRYTRKDGRYDYRIYGEQADAIVKRFPDKRLTDQFINGLSGEQLNLLVDAMVAADGHIRSAGQRGANDRSDRQEKTYISCDAILADQFQRVATLAGYPTAHRIVQNKQKTHVSERYTHEEHWIALKRLKRVRWYNVLRDAKSGYSKQAVWCPETELGTWIAYRKGKAYVTGNSALAYL